MVNISTRVSLYLLVPQYKYEYNWRKQSLMINQYQAPKGATKFYKTWNSK